MNLYFIVEGRRTERRVYPAWLSYLLPELTRVDWAYQACVNNYYLFNGNGFPSLLHNHLVKSIDEINDLGIFDYLIIVLDVDDTSVDYRIEEVNDFIRKNDLSLKSSRIVIIPQNRCIETWFLGNAEVYKSNPQSKELRDYIKFYNVKDYDPEEMGVFDGFNTHAQFHAEYCAHFLKERNIRYTKNNPRGVTEQHYLRSLVSRNSKSNHLASFKSFIDFTSLVRVQIEEAPSNNH